MQGLCADQPSRDRQGAGNGQVEEMANERTYYRYKREMARGRMQPAIVGALRGSYYP